MKNRLLPDWRDLVRRAWSIRLMALAFLFTATEVMLPFFSDAIPPRVFAVLSGVAVAGAFVARLMAQQQNDDVQ